MLSLNDVGRFPQVFLRAEKMGHSRAYPWGPYEWTAPEKGGQAICAGISRVPAKAYSGQMNIHGVRQQMAAWESSCLPVTGQFSVEYF